MSPPRPADGPGPPGLLGALALLAAAGAVSAQERPAPAGVGWTQEGFQAAAGVHGPVPLPGAPVPLPGAPGPARTPLTDDPRPLSPGRAFLLSAALPGAAQLVLDQWRWPLYLALEGGGWYGYLHYRDEARDFRAAYRTLAWEVPRQGFAVERRDGDFEYYERMAHWPASGAFDADPTATGLQPETDPATYNGSVWSLARDLFSVDQGADPGSDAYRRALDYYQDRAIPPELRWDWGGRLEERERFGRLIRASDRDFERATTLVGLIVGNHLLSAVDGYVSARLRGRGLPDARVHLLPGRRSTTRPTWILRVEISSP